MIQHTGPILLSDAPVDPEGDLIWQNTDIGMDIAMVCQTILQSEEPLVFAVHGPWGSGKTSFLKMIQGALRKQNDEKIYLCWYIASNYQAVGDVSTTLTLRILRTLSEGETSSSAEQLHKTLLKPSFELKKEVTGAYGFLQELAGKVAVLADLGVVIEDFLNGGMGSGKSKLVLMVDDLDRCTLEFIGDLVETIQRLSSVKNLFIFLAVDQNRLYNAFEKRFEDVRFERGPRWAGEKYIQHSIELPPLNERSLEEFIKQSLIPETLDEQEISQDPALETIISSVDYFKVAVRHKMPRTIKACINLIRPTLTREIAKHPDLPEDEKRKIIKRLLITYLFRDFRIHWLAKAETDKNSPEFRFLVKLEELCRITYSIESPSPDRTATFLFSVERLKAANLLENRELDIPEELAGLLAHPPFFAYEEQQPYRTIIGEARVKEELEKLYKQSEEARASGDSHTCTLAAAQAYELIRKNRRSLGNITTMTNNLGLNAEEFQEYGLAEAFYRLTLEIDPNYVRTMVNLSAFITKNRPNLYEEASNLLHIVTSQYQEDEVYYLALVRLIELNVKLRRPIDQEIAQLEKMAEEATDHAILRRTWQVMIEAGRELQAIELFKKVAAKSTGIKKIAEMQYDIAFELFSSEINECDFIALDLYRQLLVEVESVPQDLLKKAKLSYAYLLQKHGYDDAAAPLFYEAYSEAPDSNLVKNFYSRYLRKMEQYELSKKVEAGETLGDKELVFTGPTEELPKRFSSIDLPNYLSNSRSIYRSDQRSQDE